MRIALLTDTLAVGGGLEYIFQVVRGIPHHEFVVCAQGGEETARFQELKNVILETNGYNSRTVSRYKPGIIHFNHLRPLASHVVLPGRRYCPLINGIHGVHLRRYDYLHGPVNALKYSLRLRLEQFCVNRVDLNITETEADRSFVQERLGAQRVEVIPNGIDITTPTDRVAPHPSDKNQIRFVMIARFDFQKGYDLLLRAIAMARESLRRDHCTFKLFGDGPLRNEMERAARTLGISDLVQFCGTSPGVDRPLAEASCVIMPSRWEGMPFVLLEAARHAKDVICSDEPGIAEVTNHGRCATLFKNGDATSLAGALSNYLLGVGRNLGQKLQDRVVSNYSRTAMITRLNEIYTRFEP